jgi:hypothetical protein
MGFAHRLLTCALCAGLAAAPALAQTQISTAGANAPLPDSPIAQTSQPGQSLTSPSTQANQDTLQKPAGTAAAPAPTITGVAASKPAGAAYAPAKQRRVRMLLIKVGAVVAVGAAVGAVAALSAGSPSRPPGAH